MKPYAKQFYTGKKWERCRELYRKSVGGLCEVCLARGIYRPGVIVHHINHVTPDTIKDEAVLFNFDNLQLVCRDCHAKLHKPAKRFKVDDMGRVTAL